MSEIVKINLQQFADEAVAAEYRQPLKTADDVVRALSWGDVTAPTCCAEPVSVTSMLGNPYHAECKVCGKWAASVDGPMFMRSGSAVQFLDPEQVDLETEATWIIGDKRRED